MKYIAAALAAFFFTEIAGWLLHRLAHYKWTGMFHEHHMKHHRVYTPKFFSSPSYLGDPKTSLRTWVTPLFVILMTIAAWMLSFGVFMVVFITVLGVALFNDRIHEGFHLNHTRWSLLGPWFTRMRLRHFWHHADLRKNYGIYQHELDKLSGNFKGP